MIRETPPAQVAESQDHLGRIVTCTVWCCLSFVVVEVVCAFACSVFVVLVSCIVCLCMCLRMGQANNQQNKKMKTASLQGKNDRRAYE